MYDVKITNGTIVDGTGANPTPQLPATTVVTP